jgi:hypothetical protein
MQSTLHVHDSAVKDESRQARLGVCGAASLAGEFQVTLDPLRCIGIVHSRGSQAHLGHGGEETLVIMGGYSRNRLQGVVSEKDGDYACIVPTQKDTEKSSGPRRGGFRSECHSCWCYTAMQRLALPEVKSDVENGMFPCLAKGRVRTYLEWYGTKCSKSRRDWLAYCKPQPNLYLSLT